MSRGPHLVLLAAGGTGGHMFPAEAAARALTARGHRILLVTDRRGARHAERFAGAESRVIPAGGVAGRGLGQRAVALARLGIGFLAARRIVAAARPDAALGFGGYAALPTIAAALIARVPSGLHEQNAVLGRANRLLAGRVRLIAASFPATRGLDGDADARVVLTGNPVRPEIAALAGRPYAAPGSDDRIRLVVLGGSQGARVFARVVPPALARLAPALRARLAVAQQARPEDLDAVRAAYRDSGIEAEIDSFFADVPARLAAAHLLITRAGASTVAELTAAGRPAILVPYPHAIDDHQATNARAIEQAGGAWVMTEAAFSPERLAARLAELIAAPETLSRAARAARAFGRADAAERLADLVERLLPSNGGHGVLKEAAE